jgi:hypothetical protein
MIGKTSTIEAKGKREVVGMRRQRKWDIGAISDTHWLRRPEGVDALQSVASHEATIDAGKLLRDARRIVFL